LRLIGYDDDEKFVDIITYTPGCEITKINDKIYNNFSIFIHAPFKKDLVECSAEGDNSTP